MKKWLPNLLLVWSVLLCVLIAVQWFREARLRGELEQQRNEVAQRERKLDDLAGRLRLLESEVRRLDELKADLTTRSAQSAQEVVALRRTLTEAEQKAGQWERQSRGYQQALDQANASIQRQNAETERHNQEVQRQNAAIEQQNGLIRRQNTELEKLGRERNEIVEQYNKLVKEYEAVVRRLEEAAKPPAPR